MKKIKTFEGFEFVEIPAGQCPIGNPKMAGSTFEANYQCFTAVISRPILFGKFPVTQSEWERIMKDGRFSNKEGAHQNIQELAPHFPATGMTPPEADQFCVKLSKRIGQTVRLPTECEWEYVCRAGTDRAYPWGNNPKGYKGRVCCEEDFIEAGTEPGLVTVGKMPANEFGVHDVGGLVEEWVADSYETLETGLQIRPGFYPKGGVWKDPIFFGTGRVAKGSSVYNGGEEHTTYAKVVRDPDHSNITIGLRLVIDPAGDEALTRMVPKPAKVNATPASKARPLTVGGSCWCNTETKELGLLLPTEVVELLNRVYPKNFAPLKGSEMASRFEPMMMTPAPRAVVIHKDIALWAISHPEVDGKGKAKKQPGTHLIAVTTSGKWSHCFIGAVPLDPAVDALVSTGWEWNLHEEHDPDLKEVRLRPEHIQMVAKLKSGQANSQR